MAKEADDLIVALDVGTSKVVAVVGQLTSEGELKAVGMGQCESKGVKKGIVVNIDRTVESIEHAIQQAEIAAHCKIRQVYLGICGSHIQSFNSTGMVAVKDREVSASDVARVIETAKTHNIPHDQQILHVIPQEFIVDSNSGVREPIGMTGKRLEVKVHIATGASSAVQNQVKCVHRQNLAVSDLVFQPFASAEAVLTEDEKEFGVVFVDIGGGTTDIAIFHDGAVRHTAVIPIAGDQISSDIAMGLRTPSGDAEEIKIKYGVAVASMVEQGQTISVPGVADLGPRLESQLLLARIIEARLEELFTMIQTVVDEYGRSHLLARGVVLTGGTAQMRGIEHLAAGILGKVVRIGVPTYTGPIEETLKNPRYATVLGLLNEGKKQCERRTLLIGRSSQRSLLWQKIKDWFVGNF